MDILITESQLKLLFNEEYSEKVINQLITKFVGDGNEKTVNRVRNYIKLFDKIKNGPNITKKDIFTYTLPELEDVIFDYMKKENPISYKGDTDLDLVYNRDGLQIYLADTKEKCITYGDGYNFCISSRGENNLYGDYRFKQEGTPYFIFNRNLETAKDEEDANGKSFLDPNHLIVLFVFPIRLAEYVEGDEGFKDGKYIPGDENYYDDDVYYSITDANNEGESHYLHYASIERKFPSLKGLEGLFKLKELTNREHELSFFPQFYDTAIKMINRRYDFKTNSDGCQNIPLIIRHHDSLKKFTEGNFFKAYMDKMYVSYQMYGPDWHGKSVKLENYVGVDADVKAKQRISDLVVYYKRMLAMSNGRDDLLKLQADSNNYHIQECKWTQDFINYMGEMYELYKDMIHRKYELNQMKD